jgi:hypothetical protein
VAAATHPDIAGFRLATHNDNPGLAANEVELSWSHLDPGFGVKFRLIYTADTPATIVLTGNVLGDERFQDGRSLADRGRPLQMIVGSGFAALVFSLFSALFLASTRGISWKRFFGMVTLGTLGIFLIYYCFIRGATPPV